MLAEIQIVKVKFCLIDVCRLFSIHVPSSRCYSSLEAPGFQQKLLISLFLHAKCTHMPRPMISFVAFFKCSCIFAQHRNLERPLLQFSSHKYLEIKMLLDFITGKLLFQHISATVNEPRNTSFRNKFCFWVLTSPYQHILIFPVLAYR